MDSIRPRNREAVSGFSLQIGSSTFISKAVSIAPTGSADYRVASFAGYKPIDLVF
jgi:hypothetical protein